MTDRDHYILNADMAEHSGEYKNTQYLWQSQGYVRVCDKLVQLIKQAQSLLTDHQQSVNQTVPRIHDSIFVDGGRGSGKSVFLNNIPKYWQKYKQDNLVQFQTFELVFLDTIDPTLLIGNDNFANVVITHLHKYMEKHCAIDKNATQYHRHLTALAESLGQTEHDERDMSGLDRILHYHSSLDLELNFHQYVRQCCDLLSCDGIVILIDDVDMALNKAHDVLETIRRLLSCPQLVPIVCGDYQIYKQLLQDHFLHAGKNREVLKEQQAKLHLAKQYFRKIFPQQLRINMLPIELLTHLINIEGNGIKSWSVRKFYYDFQRFISPLVNGYGKSFWFEPPDTARKLTQLVKQFLHYFAEIANESEQSNSHQALVKQRQHQQQDQSTIMWSDVEDYAFSIHSSYGVIMAHSEQLLASYRHNNEEMNHSQDKFRITDIPLFSLKKQHLILRKYDEHELSETWEYFDRCIPQLKPLIFSKVDIIRVQIQGLEALKKNKETNYQTVAMGPLEMHLPRLAFPIKQINQLDDQKIQDELQRIKHRKDSDTDMLKNTQLMVAMYTSYLLYGRSRRHVHQLFFSRGMELLMQSLLLPFKNKEHTSISLKRLVAAKPYYSVAAYIENNDADDLLNIMMLDEQGTDGQGADEDETAQDTDQQAMRKAQQLADNLTNFATKLINWEQKYEQTLQLARQQGLGHLLHLVSKRVFQELYQLRKGTFDKDDLFNAVTRFEFVVKNAFGIYLKPDAQVVDQAVAKTDNIENLMNGVSFNNDPSMRSNVVDFRDRTKYQRPDEQQAQSLFKAITSHPLFQLLPDYEAYQEMQKKMREIAVGEKSSEKTGQLLALINAEQSESKSPEEPQKIKTQQELQKIKTQQDQEAQKRLQEAQKLLTDKNQVKQSIEDFNRFYEQASYSIIGEQLKIADIPEIYTRLSRDLSLSIYDFLKTDLIKSKLDNVFQNASKDEELIEKTQLAKYIIDQLAETYGDVEGFNKTLVKNYLTKVHRWLVAPVVAEVDKLI